MRNPGLYILANLVTSMQYVGKDSNLPFRVNKHPLVVSRIVVVFTMQSRNMGMMPFLLKLSNTLAFRKKP